MTKSNIGWWGEAELVRFSLLLVRSSEEHLSGLWGPRRPAMTESITEDKAVLTSLKKVRDRGCFYVALVRNIRIKLG